MTAASANNAPTPGGDLFLSVLDTMFEIADWAVERPAYAFPVAALGWMTGIILLCLLIFPCLVVDIVISLLHLVWWS